MNDVSSVDVAKSVEAVRAILVRAGLPTIERASAGRASSRTSTDTGFLTPADNARLALSSGKLISGVTIPQLAKMLKSFGWPFPEENVPASVDLSRMMVTWIKQSSASHDSEDPLVFGGRFLAKAGSKKAGADKLPEVWPPHWRLTPLEVLVFTSSFLRSGDGRAPQALGREAAVSTVGLVSKGSVCTEFRKSLGDWGEPAKVGANAVREGYIKAATKNSPKGRQYQDALGALSILEKLQRLALLYSSAGISIEKLADDPIHRLVDDKQLVGFKAVVGVDEGEWNKFISDPSKGLMDYAQNVKDCAAEIGLPLPPTLGDIAGSVADWRVEWRTAIPDPKIAQVSLAFNQFDLLGQLQHNVRPVPGSLKGETPVFTVDLTEERQRDHETGGKRKMPMSVSAELETSSVPSLQTFVGAAGGGLNLADSVVELMAGFFQEMSQPSAWASATVEYHEHEFMRFKVEEGHERLETTYRGSGLVAPPPPDTKPVQAESSGKEVTTRTFPAPGTLIPLRTTVGESACGINKIECPKWPVAVSPALIKKDFTMQENGPVPCSKSSTFSSDNEGFGFDLPDTANLRAKRTTFFTGFHLSVGVPGPCFGVSGPVAGPKEVGTTVDGELVRSGRPFKVTWSLKGSAVVSGAGRTGTASYVWTKSMTLHRINLMNDAPYNSDCIQIQIGDCDPKRPK